MYICVLACKDMVTVGGYGHAVLASFWSVPTATTKL